MGGVCVYVCVCVSLDQGKGVRVVGGVCACFSRPGKGIVAGLCGVSVYVWPTQAPTQGRCL